jgi:hypothetical protein
LVARLRTRRSGVRIPRAHHKAHKAGIQDSGLFRATAGRNICCLATFHKRASVLIREIDNFRLPLTRGPSLSQEWAKPRASDRMQTGLMPARLRKRAICGTVVRSKRCSGLTQIGHEARRHSVDPSASSRTVPQVNRSTQSVLHELSAYRNRFWQINALG